MLEPIIKTIEVPCSQEEAFGIFVSKMDSWWPKSKFTTSAMSGKPAKVIHVEAKIGGKIVEIGPDDKEYLWGTIQSYDPYSFLSMDFHIPQPDEIVKDRSLLEIRFIILEKNRTKVELTQSNWEAFGERAAMMQGGYGGGWVVIFEQAFKSACTTIL